MIIRTITDFQDYAVRNQNTFQLLYISENSLKPHTNVQSNWITLGKALEISGIRCQTRKLGNGNVLDPLPISHLVLKDFSISFPLYCSQQSKISKLQ